MLPGLAGHLLSAAFLESAARSDEHAAFRIARHAMAAWRTHCAFGPASPLRALLEAGAAPLARLLGFGAPGSIEPVDGVLAATLQTDRSRVALVVAPWGERLDSLWRTAVTQAIRRSARWCIVFDGRRLRIVDAGRLYARRFIEFDLDVAIEPDGSFAALWRTASAAALAAPDSDPRSLHALVTASDRHSLGVCRSLRDGVVAASTEVFAALVAAAPRPPMESERGGRKERESFSRAEPVFEQALTIVYRLLFLLFAEARALVPLWHPIYRESYSVEALREAAERADGSAGLWDALRAMARLAHAGCEAGDLRVTPFNGRLFSPQRTPLAEKRTLDDEKARRAVLALSTRATSDHAGRQRIAYADLGVEQLGAVYETLLDYEPHVANRPKAERASFIDTSKGRGREGSSRPASGRKVRPTVMLVRGSGVRKATGTFYTPQPIADYLVRRTLGPLVQDCDPDRLLQLRVVDPAMGSGAFLVAACRFLAQAYEVALVRAGVCHPSDFDETSRVGIRRTIAERCLYGVDLNPMAVQLARLSLWLATLAADRPLTFLDHRLQVGDSLLGAWLGNLRRAPEPRRRGAESAALPLGSGDEVGEALRAALPLRFSLESMPDDSLEQVRMKERLFAAVCAPQSALSRWKRIANVWCAAWFQPSEIALPPSAFGSLSDFLLTGRGALPLHTAERQLALVEREVRARRFFHWELEYPEVFFAGDGNRLDTPGFDAVIGNPPWDMIRADAGPAEARSQARSDIARYVRFTRSSGVYEAQSEGHANRYQLFVERSIALTRRGGRIGLVLPSGLATDKGSAPLRRLLLNRCDVDAIVGIDNHRGIFPIHRSVRFLLLTAAAGGPTRSAACRLGIDDPSQLESIGDEPAATSSWFQVRITPAALDRLSGPDLVIPSLRDETDLAIVERAAALFPALGDGTGWRARFGRELNATEDRGAFREAGNGLPVVEGKHIEPFRISLADARYTIAAADARRLLRDGGYALPRLAYRDVASATNRVTLIAAILPAGCVSTHTVLCLRTRLHRRAQHFLCGLFNSLVVNFLVRLRVTTHVTTATVERLPVPTADAAPDAFREIAALARLLSRRGSPDAFARLNARVAELYQLSRAEFEHVLGTFPLIPLAEREVAMKAFGELQSGWR